MGLLSFMESSVLSSGVGMRVLVVEDEPSIADTIGYALESEGYEVGICGTVGEAVRALEAGGWSLVLLDVGLPDGNGFELCRRVLAEFALPVIFLTARAGEIDRVVGLELGADDYVVKPFSPRELTARVRAVLRRVGQGAAAVGGGRASLLAGESAAVGGFPFEVDEERCVVRYFGVALVLPRYEYRMLCALVRHPGRVFTRGQLMDLASEEPDAAMERTVDAHVKALRAGMRAVRADVDPIVTHRGLGYALLEDWSALL
jgi:two-component system catabolic regulation response regulator CreB